jgi:tight adherence protein B
MENLQYLMLVLGVLVTLVILIFAFSGPNEGKAQSRRLDAIKERHVGGGMPTLESKLRTISTQQKKSKTDGFLLSVVPNPKLLKARLEQTGKTWTLSQYVMTSGGIALVIAAVAIFEGAPILLGLLGGTAIGLALPHKIVGMTIKKRLGQFNARFPEALELMVRGLRSGLPITETIGVVASELPGPVGVEFRGVVDRIRIGRTMEVALQETADRMGTPEVQFFCITLAIQRETGGNLAETLSNLAEVLRKRAQMKLKIKAMSSESKASAFIIGSLPFIVFTLIYFINAKYMSGFFTDERLMAIGAGGFGWMGIGAFIMAKMIDFEI